MAKCIAWRSRAITWVDTGSTCKPQRLRHMRLDARIDLRESADRPEIAQVPTSLRAATSARARANSA